MTVFNTLAFNPKYTGSETIVPAEYRGRVIIDEDEVVEGKEVVEQIFANPTKVYLVSKPVFDWCRSKGYGNVAMFDPQKTVYGTLPNGKEGAVAQGGLIFG